MLKLLVAEHNRALNLDDGIYVLTNVCMYCVCQESFRNVNAIRNTRGMQLNLVLPSEMRLQFNSACQCTALGSS